MSDLNDNFDIISPRSRIKHKNYLSKTGGSGKIRLGPEFQAQEIPNMDHGNCRALKESLLLWEPTSHLSEEETENFIVEAVTRYNYSKDQAYGLLFWHHMDIDKAKQALNKYLPEPDLWSEEEKIVFEQGLTIHGEDLDQIKKLLPEKSSLQIVNYFYRSRTNVSDPLEYVSKKARIIKHRRKPSIMK